MKTCECGVDIEFGIGPKGNKIPLEPAAHIYQLFGDHAVPVKGAFRNHYLTCPKANDFRKRAPKTMGPPGDNADLVHDLLELVLKPPPTLETIQGWTREQRAAAAEWAAREQTSPLQFPKPDFLAAREGM